MRLPVLYRYMCVSRLPRCLFTAYYTGTYELFHFVNFDGGSKDGGVPVLRPLGPPLCLP